VASIAYGMPQGLTAALSNPSMAPDGHLLMVLAGFQIANPNVVEVRDLSQYNWNLKDAEVVVFVLNSRAKQQELTKKYEVVK